MTEADEIHYNDLSDVERAAVDAGVVVRASAVASAAAVRARMDADDLTPTGYDGYGAPLYGWQHDNGHT